MAGKPPAIYYFWLHIEKTIKSTRFRDSFTDFHNLFHISLPSRPRPGVGKKTPLFMYGGAALRKFAHIRIPELQRKSGIHFVVILVLAGPNLVLPAADLAVARSQALKIVLFR